MPERRGARATRSLALATACLGVSLLGAAPPAGLLFHASFDGGPRAERSVGRPDPFLGEARDPGADARQAKHVPGAFGRGITKVAGSFHALGNVQPERGTIAFFARLLGPDPGLDPLRVRTVDSYYWGTYLRVGRGADHLGAWVPDESFTIDLSVPGPAGQLLTSERWRHVAIAWDQAYGTVLYLDGERVRSNWGERSWLSRGVDPAELALAWADGSIAYDELYVFDRALGDAQVRALARHNRAPSARELPRVEFDARRRSNRLRELGWEDASRLPRLAPGAPRVVRQVIPREARALRAEAGAVFDGKLGQGWPPLWNYAFNGGNGLSVELPEPFDQVVIEGRFRGRMHAGRFLTEPGSAPLASFAPEPYVTRWRPQSPASGWLSFFSTGTAYERTIAELGFFRSGEPAPEASATKRWFLTSAADPDERMSLELASRYGEGDRARLGIAPERSARGTRNLAGLRFQHVILPARRSPWSLRALRLILDLRGELDGLPLHVELRDPLRPGRRWLAYDVALDAKAARSGRVDLLLDLVGRVIPAGQPLWLVLCAGRDVEIEIGGNDGSGLELLEMPLAQAIPGFVERELPLVRALFRTLSEERPWVWHEAPERELVAFDLRARELFAPLTQLHELAPADPRVAALWLWTHKFSTSREPAVRPPVPGHAGAPDWAVWQRELYRRCRAVLDWWIENRQVPSGEFGDDWNDDTDFIQNFPALALLSDPGGRLRASAALVADGVYRDGRMRDGLNTRLHDPLHAYEEGMNAQQVMALLAPGEPRYLERLMDSARAIDERLTSSYAPGRRAFRASRFSADQVDTGPGARDSVYHAILFGPALSVAYRNRNPRAIRTVKEWLDGWLDAYPQAPPPERGKRPLFAAARRADGTITDRDWLPRAWGYLSLFPALDALTGEARYRDALRYWTGTYSSGFLEGVPDIQQLLELLPVSKYRAELLRWSRGADLEHLADDALGESARRRLLESELSGEPGAAIEALAASAQSVRQLHEAYTWGEPWNDRIWLPSAPLAVMAQGGLSHQRNQLWPQHHVSYEGFSDLAAWVREKSDRHLRIWLYSFAPGAEAGNLRLWRAASGRYRVRMGPARDGIAKGAASERVQLGRFSLLPVRLEPGQLVALEIDLERADEASAPLPDLALSVAGSSRMGLEVTLHNLGAAAARDVRVRIVDGSGKVLAEEIAASIEAPTDLRPRRKTLLFPAVKSGAALVLQVDPDDRIPELDESNNVARTGSRG